jgi:hypothetical protein
MFYNNIFSDNTLSDTDSMLSDDFLSDYLMLPNQMVFENIMDKRQEAG